MSEKLEYVDDIAKCGVNTVVIRDGNTVENVTVRRVARVIMHESARLGICHGVSREDRAVIELTEVPPGDVEGTKSIHREEKIQVHKSEVSVYMEKEVTP